MEDRLRKTPYKLTREQERAASRRFGRRVSDGKALFSLLFSLLCCAAPMLLGQRLHDAIPPVVATGLTGADGTDDSLPRAVLIFGVPGLFCLLDFVCHAQLRIHQRAERLPPTPVRLLGRWTLPVLSVLLCSFWILRAAGETPDLRFYLPCALGLLLLLCGANFYDCPRGSRLSFFRASSFLTEESWRKTHVAASLAWMTAGLLILCLFFGRGKLLLPDGAVTLLLLIAPLPAARLFGGRLRG